MSELSRDQVGNHCDVLAEVSIDWPVRVSLSRSFRDHDAALRAKLEEQTKRADAAEAKWHRAATHDSSIDEAEAIHELTVKVEALTAELDNYRSIAEREGATIAVSQLAASKQRALNAESMLKMESQKLTEAQATITAQAEEIERLKA